jgi:hypothetical protein
MGCEECEKLGAQCLSCARWEAQWRREAMIMGEARLAALEEAYRHTLSIIDRNVRPGYPSDPDTGECYFCGKGKPRVHDDGETWDFDSDCDHLDSAKGHKEDCAWRLAVDWLEKVDHNALAKLTAADAV